MASFESVVAVDSKQSIAKFVRTLVYLSYFELNTY